MKRRVAITGMGVVSPLGVGLERYWKGLAAGASGVRRVTRFDASGMPVRIAAEVIDLPFDPEWGPTGLAGPFDLRASLDYWARFGLAAAMMAARDASVPSGAWADADVYFGAGEGQNDVPLLARLIAPFASAETGCDVAAMLARGDSRPFALRDQLIEATTPASLVAARLGAGGEVTTCLTACAASAQAVGEAFRRIQRGECDLALAGGAHAMTGPFDLLGFAMLSALSRSGNDRPERASRPFDRDRDGFVLGEGAAALVLEEWASAHRRGANIHGELIGYGTTSDAYRVTDMHPDARGAVAAITAALDDAGCAPADVGYVNAHGTSTIENDRAETLALHRALGDAARTTPVSSTKSMTGHAIAAAGALEIVACALALREQVVPPTINYETPDPECDLDYVPNRARAHTFDVALSNSFGFGGQNVALLIRRPEGGRR
jgi:3-oxoacyl-[acyl-carrier-protein] synthase II